MLAFVLGGARSGKSTIALRLAAGAAAGAPVTVVVTAEAGDDEMAARIARHRGERDATWPTVEAPRHLPDACEALDAPAGGDETGVGPSGPGAGPGRRGDGTVLVDCVSFWVANLVMDGAGEDEVRSRAERLARWAAARPGWVVAVSNEVGAGVVPDNELARRFRDALGRANAALAAAADRAWLVAAGRAVELGPPPEAL